jgi:hypothetical protein
MEDFHFSFVYFWGRQMSPFEGYILSLRLEVNGLSSVKEKEKSLKLAQM